VEDNMRAVSMEFVVGMSTKEAVEKYPEDVESCTSSDRCKHCGARVWIDGYTDRNKFLLISCPRCGSVSTHKYLNIEDFTEESNEEAIRTKL
jgi:hypothetical protein